MSRRVLLLALAGLLLAGALGYAGSLLARDTIALPATRLSAGDRLAPPTPPTTTAPATTAGTTTERSGTTTRDDDDDDDSGRGRNRGRGRSGGDDD